MEWIAYFRLHGFTEDRAELRNGILCSLLFNINRRKGTAASKPKQFMFDPVRATGKKMDTAEIKKTWLSFLRSLEHGKKHRKTNG